jgi:Uma2 family endonuclease
MATADVLTPPEPDIFVPDGYELVDGKKVRKPVGEKSCWVGGELFGLIRAYLLTHAIGRVYMGDTGFRCFPGRPRHIRKPDVSFVRGERLSPELSDGELVIPPDLVVEVISPRERAKDLDEKIQDFQSVGVPLIWVVNPNTRTVRVLHLDGTARTLRDADTLTGEDVLPGFSCRVADFLPPVAAAQ